MVIWLSRYLVIVGTLALAGALASGCVRAKAKTLAQSPQLETPPAPPRTVETAEAAPVAPIGLIEEPAREPVRPAAPRPAPPRASTTAPRTDSADAQKADAAKNDTPTEPPKVAEEPRPSPPPTLQTTPVGSEVEVERGIRTVITRAAGDLGRVNYRALNADARTQYDTAKRFIEQAEDALRKRNLVFARNLADKALGLAAQLAGR